jgi:hypothetical protein
MHDYRLEDCFDTNRIEINFRMLVLNQKNIHK